MWHPAAATALERALHPAGHGPNSSSLLRPQAAVVAVAISAEKLFLMFANRQSLRALPVCFFTGRGRRGKRQLADACFLRKYGANPLSHRCTMPDSPFCRCATSSPGRGKSFLSGGAGERSEPERARTVVLRPCPLLYMYKSDRTAHTKHCAAGTAEFSTGRKACGLCILHRKCAL